MSSIVLTRRGRFVRTVILLLVLVAAVVAAVWLGTHVPAMGPAHITDAQWRDGVSGARAVMPQH